MRSRSLAAAFCAFALPGCLLEDPYYVPADQPAVSGAPTTPLGFIPVDDEESMSDESPRGADEDSMSSAPTVPIPDGGLVLFPRPGDPMPEAVGSPAPEEDSGRGSGDFAGASGEPTDASVGTSPADDKPDAATGEAVGAVCGDGVRDPGESCDGSDGPSACAFLADAGFISGTLGCTANCEFDTSGCQLGPRCGNQLIEEGEDCDGNAKMSQSCETLGYSGGRLACTPKCKLDDTACRPGPMCDASVGSDLGVVFSDTTRGAKNDRSWHTCSEGGKGGDLSVSWTAPRTGCYVATIESSEELDTIVTVFQSCELNTIVRCDDNSGVGQLSRVEFSTLVNSTYAILIDSYDTYYEGTVSLRIAPCPPPEWTCPADAYGTDDGCDCGCGALDFDCDDDERSGACDSCSAEGSCGGEDCSYIVPTRNYRCSSVAQ